ncbi:MAG: hypothetical protein WDN75_00290 [Bacteroidota bacterium]
MKNLIAFLLTILCFEALSQTTIIKCGQLIDGKSDQALGKKAIVVEGNLIKDIIEWDKIPSGNHYRPLFKNCSARTYRLPYPCADPGDITSEEYDAQLLKESIPYRTIRGTVAAKIAIMNGFTTIRDVETEGAMYADVDIKKAISNGVIPGPRMFVSTRAINTTGHYPIGNSEYSWELHMPKGIQEITGADEARRAVREQIAMAPTG